jgi:hypothetical protein
MSKKVKISYYSKVSDNVPKNFELHKWLQQTINPPKKLKEKVLRYRKHFNKADKESLPCVTISASFKGVRNLKNIKAKNQYIVLDIDRLSKAKNKPSNTCIDMNKVKAYLSLHPATLYCGFSVSLDGVYCVMKTVKGVSLKKYFNYLKKQLALNGIFIDESCKDYTRLRFFSYDKDAYYNRKAKVLQIPKKVKIKPQTTQGSITKNDREKVELVVSLIESHSMDITSSYEDWVKVAGALYNAFGEEGRLIFHRISKFHPDYKSKKTDSKFNGCRNMNKVSLSTFFYVASSYGIRY